MHLTRQQAEALGIGHLYPDPCPTYSMPMVVPHSPPPDGMNKLERRFKETVLEPARHAGLIGAWWREPLKLRVGGRCWYTPDFLVALPPVPGCDPMDARPELVVVETKGFLRDDAAVKSKAVAALYPQFKYLLVYRRRSEWLVHPITARGGISHANVVVPWIHAPHGG